MDFKNDKAIYLQIQDHFLDNILHNKWANGERIPSVRDMAQEVEVNPNTVLRTYNMLQEMEIIYNKRGRGYFLAEGAQAKTLEIKRQSFLNDTLPEFFYSMDLLGLDFEVFKNEYQRYLDKKL